MTDLAIPEGPEGLSADWLAAALGEAVASVEVTRIGQEEGFTGGGLYRLVMPGRSLVAKVSPTDPDMRARFAIANAREVTFYTDWSEGLPVPVAHYGDFDAASGASVLLLDDLGDARSVPFVEGLWPRDVASVVAAFAKVHAAWWNAPALETLSGAAILDEFTMSGPWPDYVASVAKLLPDVVIPPEFIALGDYAAEHSAEILQHMKEQGPLTVLHRDPQLDNILFAEDGAALLIDWQVFGKGRGTWDLAYFLISSVPSVRRRKHERTWVEAYHTALTEQGVTGYSLEDCWRDYLRSVLAKLFLTVVVTVELDNSTPHKRAYRRADLARLMAFIKDHQLTPAIWDFSHD